MLRSYPSSGRPAFTLTEALTVAGILIILAAILFPIFARTSCGSSRIPSCQSNLKAIGLSLSAYTNDYNASFPKIETPLRNGKPVTWRQVVARYLDSPAVWQCPSNANNSRLNYDGTFFSYDAIDSGPIQRTRSISRHDLQDSISTITVIEENGFNGDALQIGVRWENDPGYETWTNILFAGHYRSRQAGWSTFLFADGHVKTMKPLETIEDGVNRWNIRSYRIVAPRTVEKLQAAEQNFH